MPQQVGVALARRSRLDLMAWSLKLGGPSRGKRIQLHICIAQSCWFHCGDWGINSALKIGRALKVRVNSVRFNRELTEHPSRIQILATGPRKIPPTAQHHTLKNSYWMLRSWLKIMNHRCVWERLNMHACHEPRFKLILTWNPPTELLYPATKLVGGILDSPCLSVCLSVCPSVRLLGISMRAEGSENISPWFSRFISDSITLDMLLESDGNFGEVINGTDIRPDSMHLS